MSDWHGLAEEELQSGAAHVPEPPDGHLARQDLSMEATVYPRVHFSGNYGSNFCGEFQELERANMTRVAARQLAWSLYGLCGHQITYYDAAGNLVAQD